MARSREVFKRKVRGELVAEFDPLPKIDSRDVSRVQLLQKPCPFEIAEFDQQGSPIGSRKVQEYSVITHWKDIASASPKEAAIAASAHSTKAIGALQALKGLQNAGANAGCDAAITMLEGVKAEEPDGFII